MSSSPRRAVRVRILTVLAVVFVVLSISSGASAFVTKTITNTVTVEISEPVLHNAVELVFKNPGAEPLPQYAFVVSHLGNHASVSSTVLIPVTEIPTLSPVGAIALILFLAGFAWYLSRRRSASP